MMLGELLPAGSTFEDTPLSSSDFQFSNALESVDPTTGLPPVTQAIAAAAPAAAPSSSSTFLIVIAAAALALWHYWPRIKQEVAL
jgi:hypothetical protein